MSPANDVQYTTHPLQTVLRKAWTLLLFQCRFRWAIAIAVLRVVGVRVQPALAGRDVLNQNPAAVALI